MDLMWTDDVVRLILKYGHEQTREKLIDLGYSKEQIDEMMDKAERELWN